MTIVPPETFMLTTRQPNPPPADGIYPDMPDTEYHAYAALSGSTLEKQAGEDGSPAAVRHYLSEPQVVTEAMKLGTLIHIMLLEPDEFEARAMLGPINSKTGAAYGKGTLTWAAAEADNPGRVLYAPEDLQLCKALKAEAERCPYYRGMTRRAEGHEISAFWTDANTGVRMKGRVDRANLTGADLPFIHDLKTTRRPVANLRMLVIDSYKLGYHRKAALYLEAMRILRGSDKPFRDWLTDEQILYWVTFLSTSPPFGALTIQMTLEAIMLGHVQTFGSVDAPEDIPGSVRVIAESMRSGEWPTHNHREPMLDLPSWM